MYAENVEKMSNEDPEMKSFAPIAREEFCSKKEETLESNVLLDNCFFVIESKIKWHFSFHSITFYCFLLDIFLDLLFWSAEKNYYFFTNYLNVKMFIS